MDHGEMIGEMIGHAAFIDASSLRQATEFDFVMLGSGAAFFSRT
jgi:hypothetical protein